MKRFASTWFILPLLPVAFLLLFACKVFAGSPAVGSGPQQPAPTVSVFDDPTGSTSTKPTSNLQSDPASNLPVQKVGPDDLLSLSVADSPELTRSFRVSADGTLALPMLKKRVMVAGKSTPEIEKAITDELVDEQILVQPVVSVTVAEYRSVPVSVAGAVRHPITFQAVGQVRLLDALTKAEGLAQNAGPDILISRPRQALVDPSAAFVQRIPVKELLTEANPAANIRLMGGEEIRVPEGGRVYVLGNVKHSGAFPIQENEDLTVLKAIAECDGLMPFSKKIAFIYREGYGLKSRDEIPVQLHRILDRKAPDVALQTNDIFYIPDDKHLRIAAQTLERMVSFGVGTASGFLIFH